MADFASPPPPPVAVTYTSADAAYSVFGWRVITHRRVRAFSTLRDARAAGFTLQGSGSATVTTPARARRRTRYRFTSPSASGTAHRVVRSDAAGRLTVRVALGPSDTVQEFPADGPALGTTVYTTRISVAPVAVTQSGRR